MIADLDRTIEKLLIDEIPITNGEIDVKFEQPKREWSARLSRPTINLFLYDVRENNVLRQHQWERVANANAGLNNGGQNNVNMKRTPYRIDCIYMMTVWANDPQDEHQLMTRSMMALFRYPLIPKDKLVGDMKDQLFPIQTRLASHDKLTNPAELWGSMDNEIRPSVSYLVTLAFDPWVEITTPIVLSRTMTYGQSPNLPQEQQLLENTKTTTYAIGGTVLSQDAPQEGWQVAIKNSGFITTTNDEGKYILSGLSAGDHTLVVWPIEGKPSEHPVSVPGDNFDILL